MIVSITPANRVAPGHLDNRERWVAARITASHLNTFLRLIKNAAPAAYSGDEFESAKYLMTHFQASCGMFIDALHTATSVDQLIEINDEFYKMACAKS